MRRPRSVLTRLTGLSRCTPRGLKAAMIQPYCGLPKYCYPEWPEFGVRKIEGTHSVPSTYEIARGGLRTSMQKDPLLEMVMQNGPTWARNWDPPGPLLSWSPLAGQLVGSMASSFGNRNHFRKGMGSNFLFLVLVLLRLRRISEGPRSHQTLSALVRRQTWASVSWHHAGNPPCVSIRFT